jgi:hypothetical protein
MGLSGAGLSYLHAEGSVSAKIADRLASGQKLQAAWTIKIWDDGALSIEGPIDDKVFVLAVLENAKDAVRNHRDPRMVDIIIPKKDVSLG